MDMLRTGMLAGSFLIAVFSAPLGAQATAQDPSERLRQVLPADVAARVLAKIAEARAIELPDAALEQRALKFAAKGVDPVLIEQSVGEQFDRMRLVSHSLETTRGHKAQPAEIEAAAEALRRGVSGAAISELARTAPAGRSLAVPLYTIGSLIDRGLPSDEALRRVHERLQARAADADLEKMVAGPPTQAAGGQANKPALTGQDLAATKRPASAGPRAKGPRGVPGNPGKGARPTPPKKKPPKRGGGG
jgi:hypothetical protein